MKKFYLLALIVFKFNMVYSELKKCYLSSFKAYEKHKVIKKFFQPYHRCSFEKIAINNYEDFKIHNFYALILKNLDLVPYNEFQGFNYNFEFYEFENNQDLEELLKENIIWVELFTTGYVPNVKFEVETNCTHCNLKYNHFGLYSLLLLCSCWSYSYCDCNIIDEMRTKKK